MIIPNLGLLFSSAYRRNQQVWNTLRERQLQRKEERKARDRADRTYATALEAGRVYRTESGLQLVARRNDDGMWLLLPYPTCFSFGDAQEYFAADEHGLVVRGETGKPDLEPASWGVHDLIVTGEFDAE
jgi:hypothetical protein